MKIFLNIIAVTLILLSTCESGYTQIIDKFALIIGITGYEHYPNGEKLIYADDDAKSFAEFLKTEEAGAFEEDNIILLTNENAVRDAIYEKIDWLKNKVTYHNLVYIYFSGHGKVDENGYAYLMPYDADPKLPDSRGIRMDLFLRMIKDKLSVQHLICFIDACHAGSALNEGVVEKGNIKDKKQMGKNVIDKYREMWALLFQNPKEIRFSICSASAHEKSYEDKNLGGGHGLFTYFLIEGLKGAADGFRNHEKFDGIVTAGELYQYLYEKVSKYASNVLSRDQTPIPSGNFITNYPMSYVHSIDFSKREVINFSKLGVKILNCPDQLRELAINVEKNISLILKAMNQENVHTKIIEDVCTDSGYKKLQEIVTNTKPNPDRLFYPIRLLETSDPNNFQVRDITVFIEKENTYQLLPLCFNIENPTGKIDGVFFAPPTKIINRLQSELQFIEGDSSIFIQRDIMQFLERYQTAYYVEDIGFIEKVYSDEALIIVGKKVTKTDESKAYIEPSVQYFIKKKSEYITALKKVFEYDSFIKLEYSDIKIEKHHQVPNFFGVTLKQLWYAKHYWDEGFLFLLFEYKEPGDYIIHVRSWQDYEVDQGPLIGIHSVRFWENH